VLQKLIAATALCALVAVAPVSAQEASPPEEAGRFRLGPIRFTPVLTIANLGIDTNVFNEADDPKSDFTAVFGPRADYWIRLGRARVIGQSGVDYYYFQEYDSQRSFGTTNRARLELPLARVVPFVEGQYTNTRQRAGYEIDARVHRTETGGRGGVDLLLGGRTTVRAAAGAVQYRFDTEDVFLGASLRERMDRDSVDLELSLRRELTPLTTWVLGTSQTRDRFRFQPARDADSLKVITGFEMKPFAIISGKGFVGVRRFDTLSAAVPDYSGVVASADLAYAVRATRFTVGVQRDVTYSFEALEPYYLLTDVGGTVTQRVTSRWDVVGRAARQLLDYQAVSALSLPEHSDCVTQYGGGAGYWLGEIVRLGIDTVFVTRRSPITGRRYDGWRTGGSITYGIKTP
jgi:hypothetical protein